MARGKRPVPFRTRKLSLSAPMVLPWRRGGRVGRRRTTITERAPASTLGPFRRSRSLAWGFREQESRRGGTPRVPDPRHGRTAGAVASCRPYRTGCWMQRAVVAVPTASALATAALLRCRPDVPPSLSLRRCGRREGSLCDFQDEAGPRSWVSRPRRWRSRPQARLSRHHRLRAVTTALRRSTTST